MAVRGIQGPGALGTVALTSQPGVADQGLGGTRPWNKEFLSDKQSGPWEAQGHWHTCVCVVTNNRGQMPRVLQDKSFE